MSQTSATVARQTLKIPKPPPAGTWDPARRNDRATAYADVKKVVGDLVDRFGYPIAFQDSESWTPLHRACFTKDRTTLRYAVHNAYENAICSLGWTPLFWAAFRDDAGAAQMLLSCGSGHMVRDTNGWTALQWAVTMRSITVVSVLLQHHQRCLQRYAEPPQDLMRGLSVQLATRYMRQKNSLQETDIFKDLAPTFPPVNFGQGHIKYLGDIVRAAYIGTFSTLAGVDRLWPSGHFDLVAENVWRTVSGSKYGFDLCHFLRAMPNPLPDAQFLLKLLLAAIRDDNLLAVRVILELGADVNGRLRGQDCPTPLFAAALRRDPSFVKILLAHGADPAAQDHTRQRPLQLAVVNGFVETATALINGGADVNARFSEDLALNGHGQGWSRSPSERTAAEKKPLMLACGLQASEAERTLAPDMVHKLLLHGADVSIRDIGGMTALHYAARSRILDLILLVIAYDADRNARDRFGSNAIHHFCLGNKPVEGCVLPSDAEAARRKCVSSSFLKNVVPPLSANLSSRHAAQRACGHPCPSPSTAETG